MHYLDELRGVDGQLQHLHPCFAYFRDTFSPSAAASRLQTLHELQGKCLAINLELIWRAHALIRSPACVPVPASVPRTLRAPAWVA